MNVNFTLRLQVLGIEPDCMILLFTLGLNQERISEIFVVQMERRLVVPLSVGLHDLAIGDLGVFDKDVGIGDPLSISAADEPFDGEAMIGFVRRRADGWKGCGQTHNDRCDPEPSPSWPCFPQTGTRSCRSRYGFK